MALDRYATFSKEIPEGTEIWVPYRGDVASVIGEFTSGIRAAMGYAGASNIEELRRKGKVAKISSRREKSPSSQSIML